MNPIYCQQCKPKSVPMKQIDWTEVPSDIARPLGDTIRDPYQCTEDPAHYSFELKKLKHDK